jgi:uncharacterized delta-60 repeat protein
MRIKKLIKTAAIPLLFLLLSTVGRGQSALDGFDPNANGAIRVVVVQPDGKILIGGDFTTLSPNGGAPVTRNRIARLNPDGTLDTAFDPNADNEVYAIAVQEDGKILAGGGFTDIGGKTRSYLARLNPDGTLDTAFDPNANNIVQSIAVQTDGQIVVAGFFNGANSIGGQTRNYIARLDATTGLADSFNPNANSYVFSIAVQADGKVLAAGDFSGIGGQTRNHIARLDAATGLADSFDPNANEYVYSIAVQADGKILAGGFFQSIGGQARNNIARLDATTGLADSFNPNPNHRIISIALQADGKILVGGSFSGANSIGGQTRNNIARLDATTGLADSFDPNANGDVRSIAVQADGKILAGGGFTTLGGGSGTALRNGIGRLETDGRLDQTLNLNIGGTGYTVVYPIAVQPDGKILIGGCFTSVLGVARNNIARVNPDGTLDIAFNPNANGDIVSMTVQADGKILVGGFFTNIGGQTRNHTARLDAITGLADSFDPNANNGVYTMTVQADGMILVGGTFTSIGGQTRNRIARLDATTGEADSFDPNAANLVRAIAVHADGGILAGGDFYGTNSIGGQMRKYLARLDAIDGLADSFDPNPNNQVHAIAVQGDGKILVAGKFSGCGSIGTQTRNYIARLDASTGLADSFNPNADSDVWGIALQADGKILAGGFFNTIGGQPRTHLARLDPTTGLADSFNPNPTRERFLISIALQADGKILASGSFWTIGGQARNYFARLTNDTAALQDLTVTPGAITWVRGGSSPLCARVTFEYSNDNLSYSPLGNGAPAGSNWTLTGLSLPTGQNFFIRARGYYGSGFLGSDSITESVRNAFLAGPASTPAPTPTATPTGTPATATPTPTPTLTPTPTPTPIPTPRPINPNNILVLIPNVGGNAVREFTPAGSLVQTIEFNYNGGTYPGTEHLRDIIVDQDGVISGYNGTFAPLLTRYSSSTGTFTHSSFPGWSTVNNIYLGRITSYQNFVFVTDEATYGGEPRGIVRFDTSNGTAVRFASNTQFRSLTVGMDGNLYAVRDSAQAVAVYDPVTLDFVRDIPFPAPVIATGFMSMAVDQNSRLYLFAGQGNLYRLDSSGAVEASQATSFHSVTDIEIDESGRLIMSEMGGRVIVGDTSLSNGFTSFLSEPNYDQSSWPSFVSFARPHSFPPRVTPSPTPPAPSPTPTATATATATATSTPTATPTPTSTPGPTPGLVANIATRLSIGTGDDVLIQGFIVQGPAGSTKKVMVRVLGPFLAQFGMADALANPTLEIHDATNATVATNNDWKVTQIEGLITGDQSAEISASQLAPDDDLESAIIANLPPGNYTAVVRGLGNTTGTGIVDVYDISAGSPARLVNVATRGLIQPGDKLMIAGFIIHNAPVKAVIRAIGPSLITFGITNALPDTTLQLRDENGGIVLENDNWRTNEQQAQELQNIGLQPSNDLEAALIATIPPGQYTAQVRGKDEATGIGVVEIYFPQ